MTNVRIVALALLAIPCAGQSVVSTHSGTVYFFAGSVFIEDQRLEQKFGKFPDIGEGHRLRTEQGRAEVLLTQGAVLRVSENSVIRMLSTSLADTRVELLSGSVILEANDARTDKGICLSYKNWQVRIPQQGAYRLDSEPARLRVYRGEARVSAGDGDPVAVKEGESLPLAEVLLTERTTPAEGDSFKTWAMNRSQAMAADNATAAGIIDDPSQFDSAGLALGGYTYFPQLGTSSLGVSNPYGVSFWSPYQSVLSSIYNPMNLYGYGGLGYRGYGLPHSGWPSAVSTSPSGLRVQPRPIYPVPISIPMRVGQRVHPIGAPSLPRTPIHTAPTHTLPHPPPPTVGTHTPVRR